MQFPGSTLDTRLEDLAAGAGGSWGGGTEPIGYGSRRSAVGCRSDWIWQKCRGEEGEDPIEQCHRSSHLPALPPSPALYSVVSLICADIEVSAGNTAVSADFSCASEDVREVIGLFSGVVRWAGSMEGGVIPSKLSRREPPSSP